MRAARTSITRALRPLLVGGLLAALAACGSVGRDAPRLPVVTDPAPIVTGTMRPYQVRGRWYRPFDDPDYEEVGLASWYGAQFNGRPTASGERFDMNALTAAHKTLPLPGLVEVTNLANGRSVVLRVNDRGPFVDNRIIDLSRGAAEALDMMARGVGEVRVRYLGRAPRNGGGQRLQMAAATGRPRQVAPVEVARDYWIQAGSYADPLAARLSAEALGDTAVVRSADVEGRRLYRVMVGPWPDTHSAERGRQDVVARGFADAQLISGR